jgi:putative sterol carrier protein
MGSEFAPLLRASALEAADSHAVPDRLARVAGAVRFDLERKGVLLERCGLVLERQSLKLLPDLPESAPVDVVLRTSILSLVRLISGERSAGLEYLSGGLDIEGDAELALALGGVSRVPGSAADVARVRDGVATAGSGDGVDTEGAADRDATVTCGAHEFLRLATGHLSAMTGVLRGQSKVRGDRAKALQLSSIMDIPRAR